jgi:small GTP-binding protein
MRNNVLKQACMNNNNLNMEKVIIMQKTNKICVLGLDRAGKTTMLQRLKTGRWIPDTTPTIGMNAETIRIGDVKFTAWDLGGQLQFRRALWKMYTKNAEGLIYVVDVSDPARYPEARTNLWRMLKEEHLKKVPVAIFANKVDLIDCSEDDLANYMGISKKMNRLLNIFRTSAVTGEGIHRGIYWLSDAVQDEKRVSIDMYYTQSLFGRVSTILV